MLKASRVPRGCLKGQAWSEYPPGRKEVSGAIIPDGAFSLGQVVRGVIFSLHCLKLHRSFMSLSQRNLSSIQKAGQAVHGASDAIAASALEQSQGLVALIASHPFGVESEQAIARFKQLSSLSQGLIAVEAQLQQLYALAGELANPASDVIVLPSASKRVAMARAAAVDVVAKPAKAAKKVKRAGRKPAALTANDAKLLAFLQKKLKADQAMALTGAQISVGAKLPLGSVGVSLKKIVASGAVTMPERGTYQLGTVAPVSPAPESKPTPAKKSKADPKKAKPAAVEAPAVKPVKAKAANKAKSAPAKKPMAAVETPAPEAPVEEQAVLV